MQRSWVQFLPPIWRLTIACNYSSTGSDGLFWHHGFLHACGTCVYAHTYTHIYTIRVKLNHYFLKIPNCWAWWYIPVIPIFRRLRQEDGEFEASLCNFMTCSQKGWEADQQQSTDLACMVQPSAPNKRTHTMVTSISLPKYFRVRIKQFNTLNSAVRRLERRLTSYEHCLLLQKTWAQVSSPPWQFTLLLLTPVPRDLKTSSGLCWGTL